MPTIIKKGTNPSSFRVRNKTIVLRPNILTFVSDEDFMELKNKWWGFIGPRVISDKNPAGCFIISEKSENYTSGFNKEVGEVKDNSSKLEDTEFKEEVKKVLKKRKKKW